MTVRGDLALMIGWQEIVTHHRRNLAGLRRGCSITVAAVSATQGSLPSKLMTTFRGRVAEGVGDLATWMIRYAAAYERAVGVALEPGSLNVAIGRPWIMHHPMVRLEADEVGVGLGFVSCQVGGLAGWIVRTDKNNQGWGDHALDVLEIVSPVHLRTALGLVDGDDVVVEVDELRLP